MTDFEPARVATTLLLLGFPILLAVAAAGDVARYRIGNRLNLALACLYLPAALATGAGLGEIAWHLAAGLAVLAVGLVLFVLNRLGGGDVKLLAAAACWTGFAMLPAFLIVVGLAGGVLALGLLVIRRLLRGRTAEDSPPARLLGQTRDMPYGIAIAAGGLVVWPKMDLVTRFLMN